MVATADGARLTEAHRLAQAELVRQAQAAITLAFRHLLDPRDLDGTFSRYASTTAPLVQAYRDRASGTALSYYRLLRDVEGVSSPLPALDAAPAVDELALATSLSVTGPVAVKSKVAKGASVEDAFASALVQTLGAAGRHVTNAQRETLAEAVRRDPASRGYARITDGRPCYFCAMLVGRGPVYKSQATADFRSHDHCGCGVAPFFEGSDGWTAQAREFAEVYEKSQKLERFRLGRDLRPDERIPAFRRHYAKVNSPEDRARREAIEAAFAKPKPRVTVSRFEDLPRFTRRRWPETDEVDAGLNLNDDVRAVNPNYSKSEPSALVPGANGWGVNCTKCVNALELRRRGYDVEAGFDSAQANVFEIASRWKRADNGAAVSFAQGTQRALRFELDSWPDGARGFVNVVWSHGRSAHIFSVEKVNGELRWMDPQPGTAFLDVDAYFARAHERVAWLRVDDLEPTERVLEWVTPRPVD